MGYSWGLVESARVFRASLPARSAMVCWLLLASPEVSRCLLGCSRLCWSLLRSAVANWGLLGSAAVC